MLVGSSVQGGGLRTRGTGVQAGGGGRPAQEGSNFILPPSCPPWALGTADQAHCPEQGACFLSPQIPCSSRPETPRITANQPWGFSAQLKNRHIKSSQDVSSSSFEIVCCCGSSRLTRIQAGTRHISEGPSRKALGTLNSTVSQKHRESRPLAQGHTAQKSQGGFVPNSG